LFKRLLECLTGQRFERAGRQLIGKAFQEVLVGGGIHILVVDQLGATGLVEQLEIVLDVHAHLAGDLLFGWRPLQALLQGIDGILDLPAGLAQGPGGPVGAAQFVQHGDPYPLRGVGHELCSLVVFIAIDGVEQTD